LPWLCLLIHDVFQKENNIAKTPASIINKMLLLIFPITLYTPYIYELNVFIVFSNPLNKTLSNESAALFTASNAVS